MKARSFAALCLFFCLTHWGFAAGDVSEPLARARALGIATMEEDDFSASIAAFQQATDLAPESATDWINLGKAQYHGEAFQDGIASLKRGLELAPGNPIALYNLGLIYKTLGDFNHAEDAFRQVVESDASDPASLYNYGLTLANLGREDEAVQWFEKTIEADPTNSSAVYRLLLHAAKQKDREKSMALQKQFQALKKNEIQRPPDAVDEGKFFGPIEYQEGQLASPETWDSSFRVNNDWAEAATNLLGTNQARLLAWVPLADQFAAMLFVSTRNGVAAITINAALKEIERNEITNEPAEACRLADYDNDKRLDVLLIGRNGAGLFHQEEDGSFHRTNAIDDEDMKGVNDACWADFDHEGDLDLFLARPGAGDRIYQNNSDGSFENVTGHVEGLDTGASVSIAFTDLGGDNDLDAIALHANGEASVFTNQRERRFQPAKKTILFVKDVKRILTADPSNQMERELITIGANGLFHIAADGAMSERQSGSTGKYLTVGDFSNDGFDELVSYDEYGSLLFTTLTPETTSRTSLAIEGAQEIVGAEAADLDLDGDLDLWLVDAEGRMWFIENRTEAKGRAFYVQVHGVKNNTFGYGAKLWLKDGLFRAYREISKPVTAIGIGRRESVEVARLTWPNGIFQNVMDATTAAPDILSVTEKPGYAGSCPFIYTWNGERYEFISDALSTGPLGLYVGGGFFPPRPEEYVRIRPDQLTPRNGSFSFRILEELREITYLDQLELLSASHPEAKEIHVNECFTVPPFPEFKLVGMSNSARPVKRMIDNHGTDVTELVAANDHRYPQPFHGNTHYEGVDDEYWFEIDLNDVKDAPHVMLFMTGYVDWPNSSVARSLEQNPSLDFVMPYLQVKDRDGEWKSVMNPMGFPAGKLKTVPLDVSNVFLSEDHTLRIVSTLMVNWDRIWVDTNPILDGFKISHHPMKTADFRYSGFSRMYDLGPQGPHWYDYTQRSSNHRWSYNTGFYTRYGDVFPLLGAFDDQYVIMAPGDEVAAEFDDNGLEPGATYFLRLKGWVKDADESTAFGETVEPLPFQAMSAYPYGADESYPMDEAHLEYLSEYNTREISSPNEGFSPSREWTADRPIGVTRR
ncbi:MAG: tetratricopeptide repeat protein [bacterium]|nr:tetratricopeptide repeat protein [bacterium]